MAAERVGERERVIGRLGDAGADVRARHECGVAQNRDPAERHARHFQVVDRLQERLRAKRKHFVELRRKHLLSGFTHARHDVARDQRRRDRERVGAAALVGQQARQFARLARRPVPDEIVAAVARAQIIVRPGDRIAEHLLVVGQAEREVLEQLPVQRGRKCRFGHQPAPGRVAGVERAERGEILLPHGRADAVGADQQVAFGHRTIGEMRRDALRALRDLPQLLAALVEGLQRGFQQMKYAVPRRHGLRPVDPVRHRPVVCVHHARRHLDAEIAVGVESERAQRGLQFRLRHDAGAAPGKRLGDALVDRHVPPAAHERDAGEQAAHRSADHQRAPRNTHKPQSSFRGPGKLAIA